MSERRHQEMLADLADLDDTDGVGAHIRRMIERRFPMPHTEKTCHICPSAQAIVAYQRVGWVLAREPTPNPEEEAERKAEALRKQLAKAEQEAARLRIELADAEFKAR